MFAPMLLAAVLAAAPPAGPAPAAGKTPAEPRPARLLTVEGVPPDSALHAAFMAGFDEALAAATLAIEARDASGAWRPAGERASRFALVADPEAAGAWTLQAVVRAPPPFSAQRRDRRTNKLERVVDPDLRASRGMTVALLVLSPEAIAGGARAMPDHHAFAFPQEAAPATVLGRVPRGFRFPWHEAGRTVGTLALELLHRRAGDLGEDERCVLAPAVRVDAVR